MSGDQTPEQAVRAALLAQNGFAQENGFIYMGSTGDVDPDRLARDLSAAGFAVVKLPEPDDLAAEQRRYSLSVPGGINGLPPIREDSAGWTLRRFASSEARRQAAALLATADQADAAEAGQ
ncbi:MAG: hypothetical protein CMH38_03165 [Microbacterium sp.]|uniref:hypothetical protein n=1 Tax=Microbacterium sp. TaxID=51671 RepID=UPI000C6B88E1|nr:hypothetical protein [Microbacterium sp.]MAY48840.1 hypothetical protein [Microbacterium sp.]MAY48922.1 hypothetical protein [Microbacterium sp.]|tara:strand:+ start:36580 stop:36942 length:363 start_codon:yes stop_codon:yes gene_type:complete